MKGIVNDCYLGVPLFQTTGPQTNNEPLPSRELTYPFPKAVWKMNFLFPRWDMLVSWRVSDRMCFSITEEWIRSQTDSIIDQLDVHSGGGPAEGWIKDAVRYILP